ncbi:hypothetical protein BUZ94_13065 [Mammaliicoccus sciuri]|uniref:class III lanthionine synthetase LanKC n=1 Tax=Mammaliicoccus sciuri TaxID=1296 RepID=UPI000E67A4DA|nr:class III lanthionine synthetase LanKC [Mammaliicoccus sciuri]RIO07388.1 hypothetical protein BUZ94_13065 [Mammaliicoccus sciuri]
MQPIKNSVHNQLLPFNKYTYESTESYMPKFDYLKFTYKVVEDNGGIIENKGLWTYVNFKTKIPDQGWKVHISANLENDIDILNIVTEYCAENKITFKHLSDKFMLVFLNGKYINRGSAGKFITIYPSNCEVFKKTLDDLYNSLNKFEGSYILSDKRYKDCKVLYYRFGGINGKTELNYRGEQEYYLTAPNGEKVSDTRYAYWNPPYWIEDPFEFEDNDDTSDGDLLHDRYRIDDVIEFSADGGVYSGLDTFTQNKVVIKEARPNTAFDLDGIDAVDRLINEYEKLKKLEYFEHTPNVIEKFYEWEHLFLVEEFLEGQTLNTYMMSISPIMKNSYNKNNVDEFNNNLKSIFKEICNILGEIHNQNIILQDISPRNIMVDLSDKKIKFIDLETAFENSVEKATTVRTPGFYNVNETEKDDFKVEIKNLSFLFFSCVFPINSLFTLDKEKFNTFLDSFVNYGVLNKELANIIKRINTGELNKTIDIVEELNNVNPFITKKSEANKTIPLEKFIDKIEKGLILEAKNNKSDKLFASDPMGIFTNNISIAYGATGVLFSLLSYNDKSFEVDKIVSWLIEKTHRVKLSSSLFNGYAGIAYMLADLGYNEISKTLMKKANESEFCNDCFDLFYGLSGIGLTNLKLFNITNDEYYLKESISIGDKIIDFANFNVNNSAYWPDKDNSVYFGLGRGSSGIALFLLYLYLETRDDKYIKMGVKAIKYELDNLYYDENGSISILRGELSNQENVQSPYLYDGASGLGSVILRYKNFLDNDVYNEILTGILKESLRKYVAFPSLMRGLTGIGHFALDCYLFEKDDSFKNIAYEILDTLHDFSIEIDNKVYFSGEQLYRFSSDYSTGSAGVLTFLKRLKNFNADPYNYNFYLDHFYKKDFNI